MKKLKKNKKIIFLLIVSIYCLCLITTIKKYEDNNPYIKSKFIEINPIIFEKDCNTPYIRFGKFFEGMLSEGQKHRCIGYGKEIEIENLPYPLGVCYGIEYGIHSCLTLE